VAQSVFNLAITRLGTGSGTVSGPGITCGADCQQQFVDGSQVTLVATAAQGPDPSTFAGWGGACGPAGTSPSCTLTVHQNTLVTASFERVNVGVHISEPTQPRIEGVPYLMVNLSARPGCGPIKLIQFGEPGRTFDNAMIGIVTPTTGPLDQTSGFVYTPPDGTTVVAFGLQRLVQRGGATVSPIVLRDGCGDWHTFVGGGPDAFH
jgi:hypothetical protein